MDETEHAGGIGRLLRGENQEGGPLAGRETVHCAGGEDPVVEVEGGEKVEIEVGVDPTDDRQLSVAAFQGVAITMIVTGVMAMAFMGFAGMVSIQ